MDKRYNRFAVKGHEGQPAPGASMVWRRMVFLITTLTLCLLLTALWAAGGAGRKKGVETPLALDAPDRDQALDPDEDTDPELLALQAAVEKNPAYQLLPGTGPLVWKKARIRRGDTLSDIFVRHSLDTGTMYRLLRAKGAAKLKNLRPGAMLHWGVRAGQLVVVRYTLLEFTRTDKGFDTRDVVLKPEVRQAVAVGVIEDSLFTAAAEAGLSHHLIMGLATIFGWDIDFALDVRKGDSFRILYEENYLDGELVGHGRILAASFRNRGRWFRAVLYTDSAGKSDFYTPEGRSLRKSFLRTPVEFTRISSHFDPHRLHPIFKTKRPHRGVDYAAPTGTPIKAAGGGVVHFAGRQRGYGKVVFIKHPNDIMTVYAHQSRIASGMQKGRKVSQGQIIGYVGQTGWATGPHLHYEFRLHGRHRDPLTVKLPDAEPLPASEMPDFRRLARVQLGNLEQVSSASEGPDSRRLAGVQPGNPEQVPSAGAAVGSGR